MYELIEHKKLDSTAAGITFSNIPQIYTDLVVIVSGRGTQTDANGGAVYNVRFNGSSANYSGIRLAGNGSSAFSSANFFLPMGPSDSTANTFGNSQIYMPNYRSAAAKSWSGDSVNENNATNALQYIVAGLWNDTSPITSIQLIPNVGSFVQHSSATLYGINRNQAVGKPKAIGGNITYANGYWVHTFTGSGSFYAQEDLEVDALVVAGGGAGGGVNAGGGGGAGGFRTLESTLSPGAYPVLVGSGGASVPNSRGFSGGSSLFLDLTSAGGGGGGGSFGIPADVNGAAGGSGGGASFSGSGGAGNTPSTTPPQGSNGGEDATDNVSFTNAGGGGGAASAAGNATSSNGGGGGAGKIWNGAYYAGGGGGNAQQGTGGLGGIGGGGNGGPTSPTSGQANTGGGGGGNQGASGAGGSGVVIVRYRA